MIDNMTHDGKLVKSVVITTVTGETHVYGGNNHISCGSAWRKKKSSYSDHNPICRVYYVYNGKSYRYYEPQNVVSIEIEPI